MVKNEVPAKYLNVFAKWKDHSEEQNNTYVTIQTMSKHLVSPLNSHQTVHRHYSSKQQTEWAKLANKVEPLSSCRIFPDRFPMLGS